MQAFPNTVRISADASFFVMLAAGLLLLPMNWLLAALCAAVFHEVCHYIALRLCGVGAVELRITCRGAVMQCGCLSAGKELLCALAGPAGGLLLALYLPGFPALGICALAQTAFNLLPIYPLDGGRALRCAASMLLQPEAARRLCLILRLGAQTVMAVICIYLSFGLGLGIAPLAVLLLLVGKKDLAN